MLIRRFVTPCITLIALTTVLAAAPGPLPGGGCGPDWTPTSGGAPGVNGGVWASAMHDDGSGPALYVAGFFFNAGGVPAGGLARWDGSAWSAVGNGIGTGAATNDRVLDMQVFDDGSGNGPELYIGGWFTEVDGLPIEYLAKWDGSTWSAVDTGPGWRVIDLEVYDDGTGSGPALFVGGADSTPPAGTPLERGLARWDGTTWSSLPGHSLFSTRDMTTLDLGSGERLYVSGYLDFGAGSAYRIANWDGTSWELTPGAGSQGIQTMLGYDDGSGPALYVGGNFTTFDGLVANGIARWDGTTWTALGSGLMKSGEAPVISDLVGYDDGSGPELFAVGRFDTAGSSPASNVASWDGTQWAAVGSGLNLWARCLVVDHLSTQASLFAAGDFSAVFGYGNLGANRVARWDGVEWSRLGSGLDGPVLATVLHDDGGGAGNVLYAGGEFTTAGGVELARVGRWDGASWSPVGLGIDGLVYALAVHDDGSGAGDQLYAGGDFFLADGLPASRVARWDGVNWTALGGGLNDKVFALARFDDGSGAGPELYAGGEFTLADGAPAQGIAKWNGVAWQPVGGGLDGVQFPTARAFALYDDGSGAALFVGGQFKTAGGVAARNIARWDGSSWQGLSGGVAGVVHSLAVFADGAGQTLHVGGDFVKADGQTAAHLARWDGSAWAEVGGGLDGSVLAMTVHPGGDEQGPALFVGGEFELAGATPAANLARWNGSTWSATGSGTSYKVEALAGRADASGAVLYVGGRFAVVPDTGDSYLATWAGCEQYESYCSAGISASGCAALLSATGTASASASSGFDLTASAVEGQKDGLFFYGTNGRQANTWGSGTSFVCVVPPRLRGGLLIGSGTPGACDGAFAQDLNARWCATCPKPSHNPGAGAVVQAQLWYRDPQNTSNQTSSMSDAIEFVLAP